MCAHWELCRLMKIGQRSLTDWCCLLSTGGWFTIRLCKKCSDYVLFKIPPWSRQAVWHPWRKLDVSGDRRSLQGVLPHHTTLPYLIQGVFQHTVAWPHHTTLPHLMTLTCRQRSSATTGKPASGMLCLTTACWSSRSWSVSSVSFYHRPFGIDFSFLMPRLETGGRSCVPSSISRFLRLLTPGFQLYLKACYS